MKVIHTIFTINALFFIINCANAQINQNQQTNAPALSNRVGVGEQFITSPPYEKKLLGNPYLEEEWMKGKLKVKGGTEIFSLDKVKYNVAGDLFEIIVDDKVLNISGVNVEIFELIDDIGGTRRFVKCVDYQFNGTVLSGYFEILYEGEVILFQRAYPYIKRATYNQALMIGEKDDTIIIKEEFYYSEDASKVMLIKKSKDLKPLMKDGSKPKVNINRSSLISYFKIKNL